MMPLIPLLQDRLDEIRALCREYGVVRLEVFGSACTPAFDPARSDIDFLVTYPNDYDYGPWLSRLQQLEEALGLLFDNDVDLVTNNALSNRWFRKEADKTRKVIYDASQVSEVA